MHNSFILYQYICYIIILDMFRAVPRLSSGGQIASLQHLVSSLSVNSRTVCRLRADCSPHTVRLFTESDDTRCCNNTICLPEDERGTARNMSRIIMYHIYCYRIKELCVKLVIWNNCILWCTVRKISNSSLLVSIFNGNLSKQQMAVIFCNIKFHVNSFSGFKFNIIHVTWSKIVKTSLFKGVSPLQMDWLRSFNRPPTRMNRDRWDHLYITVHWLQ